MDIELVFKHHTPTERQLDKLELIRSKAKELAQLIQDIVPESADRAAAFRKLRECVMTANAAIVLQGRL
jgi:hypothetical protein